MTTKRRHNSVKGSRAWLRLSGLARGKRVRMADRIERYRPAKRVKRWFWRLND